MEICQTIADLKSALWGMPRVVLVPTMGALHDGHLALIREARAQAGETGTVVVSIFVNPTQFGPGEDFTRYPREPEEDAGKCEAEGVDLVFMPDRDEMYAPDASVKVAETRLSTHLCGRSRPGHFPAVCTVVLKLFHIVRPDVAVFGNKDYQQVAVVRRMVRDLNLDVEIVGVPAVRESDGLALSSRNLLLSAEERRQAAAIPRALQAVQDLVKKGERDGRMLESRAQVIIRKAPLARIDYVTLVDAEDLQPLAFLEGRGVLAVAVHLGGARLIDNVELEAPVEEV